MYRLSKNRRFALSVVYMSAMMSSDMHSVLNQLSKACLFISSIGTWLRACISYTLNSPRALMEGGHLQLELCETACCQITSLKHPLGQRSNGPGVWGSKDLRVQGSKGVYAISSNAVCRVGINTMRYLFTISFSKPMPMHWICCWSISNKRRQIYGRGAAAQRFYTYHLICTSQLWLTVFGETN